MKVFKSRVISYLITIPEIVVQIVVVNN